MGIWRINRTYQNLQRTQSILNILIKHGFGQLVRKLGLFRLLPLKSQAFIFRGDDGEPSDPLTMPERFRTVLEELGPTFIKFGQVLSSRPDMIPQPFVHELKKLREDVSPLNFRLIHEAVEKEIGCPLREMFDRFDEIPIGTASIAQVHTAKLCTGEDAVVKVQRPGIEKIIRNDLDILLFIADLLERHIDVMANFNPVGLVSEFQKSILKELDFSIEAINIERFRSNFQDDPVARIPIVYWKFSGKRVLTMERIIGRPMDDFEYIRSKKLDKKELARQGMRVFLRQVLEFGLFHADPHPGNVIVMEDGSIGLVDFGMVGRLDHHTDEYLSMMILSLIEKDYDRMIIALRQLGFEFDDIANRQIRMELAELVDMYYGLPLKHLGLSDLIKKLIETAIKFKIKVPAMFLTLSRALVIAEGIGRQLDPDIDVISIGRPMITDILKRKNSPQRMLKDTTYVLEEFRRIFNLLPRYTESILQRVMRGKLRIEFAHVNLENFIYELDRIGNRISFSIITAGLILGSSLIVHSGLGPYIFGVPVLGIAGYCIAGLLGLGLMISIIRSGRY